MKKVTKYFVTFFSPGAFVAETSSREIAAPQPNNIEWPKDAYSFVIDERVDVVDGRKTYKGESKQVGPMYYHPDSKVETLEEVRKNPNATPIPISNMKGNGWDEIIWSRWGNWPQPFDREKHKVLGR